MSPIGAQITHPAPSNAQVCNVDHIGMIDHFSFDSQAAALQLQKKAIYRAATAAFAAAAAPLDVLPLASSTMSGASGGLPPPSSASRGAPFARREMMSEMSERSVAA